MPSVRHIDKSVKILIVKCLCNNCEAKWKILAKLLMGNDRKKIVTGTFLWQC